MSSTLTCAWYPFGTENAAEHRPVVWKAAYDGACSSWFAGDEIDACYNAAYGGSNLLTSPAPVLTDTSAYTQGADPSVKSNFYFDTFFRMDCAANAAGSYRTQHTAQLTTHPDGSRTLQLSRPVAQNYVRSRPVRAMPSRSRSSLLRF